VLDLDWVVNSLKEARDAEDWDLVKEIISYLENQDDFDEDDWAGSFRKYLNTWGCKGFDRCYLIIECSRD